MYRLHRLIFASDRRAQFVATQRPRNVRITVSQVIGIIFDKRYLAEALRLQRHHFSARRRSQLSCNMATSFATCGRVARMWPHLVARMWRQLCGQIPFAENKHGHKLWPQSGHTFRICLDETLILWPLCGHNLWPPLVSVFRQGAYAERRGQEKTMPLRAILELGPACRVAQ